MTALADARIAVVGGGIGGLTAALALRKAGLQPTLFEQAERLGDVGAGISITPNAAKGLISLGLGEELAASAAEVMTQEVRDSQSEALLMRIDRTDSRQQYGAPYYMLHRADLNALLVAACERAEIPILLGARAIALDANSEGVAISFENGTRWTGDALIAADGLHSVARAALFEETPAHFTGHVAWRGLVPADTVPSRLSRPGSVVWTGAGKSFVRYPVRGGTLVNYVGLSRTDSWREESWSQQVDVEEALGEYEGWPEEVQTLIRATPGGKCHSWGLFTRLTLSSFVRGPVALLGDAAHPMLPFMGQGAAMAIEDAVVLGRCFAAGGSLTEALERYSSARVPRSTFIQEKSAAGADRLQVQEKAGASRPAFRGEDALGLFHYDPATCPLEPGGTWREAQA